MEQSPRNGNCVFYSRGEAGHRASYLAKMQRYVGGRRENGSRVFLARAPALFLMIEDNFLLYALAGIWRALLGRRTVGLLFRPLPAVDGRSTRLRFKRAVLRLLKKLTGMMTLAIVPIPLAPRIGAVLDGWVYDLQLWDIGPEDRRLAAELGAGHAEDIRAQALHTSIRQRAEGRPVLVALGSQSRAKGFTWLSTLVAQGAFADWHIAVIGRIAPGLDAERAILEACGHQIVDRFVSDGEMIASYAVAHAVWCCYAPDYDQASGILGRAIQFGCPALVRSGALSEGFCRAEGAKHLPIDQGTTPEMLATALQTLPAPDPQIGEAFTERFRNNSLSVFYAALGIVESEV